MPESLFHKGLQRYSKRDSGTDLLLCILRNFTFFTEHLWTTVCYSKCITMYVCIFYLKSMHKIVYALHLCSSPIKKNGWHGKCSVKIRSGKCSLWYIKRIWKWQYQHTDTKINLFTWYHYSVLRYHFLSLIQVARIQDLLEQSQSLFWSSCFAFVKQLTYSLASFSLYTFI